MKFIDSIRKMTEEALDDAKWIFRRKDIERAYSKLIDKAEESRVSSGAALLDLQRQLTKVDSQASAEAVIKEIASLEARIEAETAAAVRIQNQRDTMFSD